MAKKTNIPVSINIPVLEKSVEIAKDFIDKMISPSVEEVGLLFKDKVNIWRFKNHVKSINKTKDYCVKHNISPKVISLKLLYPLLEFASLEEDEELQDKWAILLGNMVDSEQNIQNHVFPYLLSQISKNEFEIVERIYKENRLI